MINTMGAALDLTGKKSGLLTALAYAESRRSHSRSTRRMWWCKCECGNTKLVPASQFKSGAIKSCGCLRGESHGMAGTPEYLVWLTMKARCANPKSREYKWYGARGIRVVDRWQSFSTFMSDMGRRPSSRHWIDRIDNDGPYAPENCRWATVEEQSANRSNTRFVMFCGVMTPLSHVARQVGIDYYVLYQRLKRHGWPVDAEARGLFERSN